MDKDNITTALFDFDGVIADTEPQYEIFWRDMAERFHVPDPDFIHKIKGTTIENIFSNFFSHLDDVQRQWIVEANARYDKKLEYREVAGSICFLHRLKQMKVKLGVVTSSNRFKLDLAMRSMGIHDLFDMSLSGDQIQRGKPDPSCYLLAAERLHAQPAECVVFEDSFPGIAAGKAAGMKVIGLATTNSEESLKDKVDAVFPDFKKPEKILLAIGL